MCITFFYINGDQKSISDSFPYKFVLGFNRDENFSRKTERLSDWEEDLNIWGGKDLVASGTWLGVNKFTGNIAFLTNARDSEGKSLIYLKTADKSRGDLTKNFLESDFYLKRGVQQGICTDLKLFEKLAIQYIAEIQLEKSRYKGFNLVIGNLTTMQFFYTSNLYEKEYVTLGNGCHGMTNSPISDLLPKAKLGLELFGTFIEGNLSSKIHMNEKELKESVLEIMRNNQRFDLKTQNDKLSIFLENEYLNYEIESSIFVTKYVTGYGYNKGTRTTSLVLLDAKNYLQVSEYSYEGEMPPFVLSEQIGVDSRLKKKEIPEISLNGFSAPDIIECLMTPVDELKQKNSS